MATSYSPKIVSDGLVLCLDASNPRSYVSGSTDWRDLSNVTLAVGGGNRTGSLQGPSSGSNAIVFDGINDLGLVATPVATETSQSFEVWVGAQASPSAANGFGYILHNSIAGSSIGASYITIAYSGPEFGLLTNEIFASFNGQISTMGTGVVGETGTVRCVTLTWDMSTQSVYVDGILRVSQPLVAPIGAWHTTTSFGDYRTGGPYRPITGSMHVIRVYNKALSAQEVLQNFNATRGRFGV